MTLVSLDPGINGCGVAQFLDGVLVRAVYVPSSEKRTATLAARVRAAGAAVVACMPVPADIVSECPQIYPSGRGKGNPNTLLPLAQIGAFVAAHWSGSRWVQVLPHEWKGNLDADLMILRIKSRLTSDEKAAVISFKRGGLDHNTYDAVGIGLHYLGRLACRKVYPR